jgi:hypothetical protein
LVKSNLGCILFPGLFLSCIQAIPISYVYPIKYFDKFSEANLIRELEHSALAFTFSLYHATHVRQDNVFRHSLFICLLLKGAILTLKMAV